MGSPPSDEIDEPTGWTLDLGRTALAMTAALLLIGAIALAIASVRYHQVITVTARSNIKTTVTGPPRPSVGLISACLGAGVILLLVAAFFNRVAEITLPFGSVKLTAKQAAAVTRGATKAAQGDPDMAAKIAEQITPQVAKASRTPLIAPRMESSHIDDDLIEKLATNAAANLSSSDSTTA